MPPMSSILRVLVLTVLATALTECASVKASPLPSPHDYRSIYVERLDDDTGQTISPSVRDAIRQQFKTELEKYGFEVSGKQKAQADLQIGILSCTPSILNSDKSEAVSRMPGCIVSVVLVDGRTTNIVSKWILQAPSLPGEQTSNAIASFAHTMAQQTAQLLSRAPVQKDPSAGEDLSASGAHVVYQGNGIFVVNDLHARPHGVSETAVVDLKHITHNYDPAIDKDVPYYTDVTLNDVAPAFVDKKGRHYAQITLYHVNPPLAGQPSREPGIDRGIDFRTPADLVQSAYSNYVSPVLSNDTEQRRISSHPIGHFYVKVEIPGYPTVLTGMTTIQRADAELSDTTIGRELGIGGVLLTPQPGRLNSAMEAARELTLRQRELRVVDGLNYERVGGRNVGPEYIQNDGNVAFARFKIPLKNAKDALAYFVEFVARGEQNIFGSLINRPNKGTGSGCTPFAISWLEASGVIPFLAEPAVHNDPAIAVPMVFDPANFWRYFLGSIDIPWRHIGCDDRLGVNRVVPAEYTIHDLLFHGLSRKFVEKASAGLAQKIRGEYGFVAGTLFEFGALTPIRDIVVYSKRKDPGDIGNYHWATEGAGLRAQYWDNSRFSHWIGQLWLQGTTAPNIRLVREGRFKGVEVDATSVDRQRDPFFGEADLVAQKKADLISAGVRPTTCEQLFSLGIQ